MSRIKDMVGQKFGRLEVVSFDHLGKTNFSAYWKCKCECGNETIVRGSCLRNGESTSCGCFARELSSERNSTHGCKNTRLYHVWVDMKQRCTNSKQPDFPTWGGRGITVCEEWSKFEPFYEWAINNGYQDDLTIDRIDNDGNYCPENCRWATYEEQANNRRSTQLITYNGETYSTTKWSKKLGGNRNIVNQRLKRGWSIEKALTTPVKKSCGKVKKSQNESD